MTNQIRKWRDAHREIEIADDALATASPFPSLFASDAIVYLQSKGMPEDALQLVRDLYREIVWTYDNWSKTQRDSGAAALLSDIINSASGGKEYEFVSKFLRDYARANNISIVSRQDAQVPAWVGEVGSVPSANEVA